MLGRKNLLILLDQSKIMRIDFFGLKNRRIIFRFSELTKKAK